MLKILQNTVFTQLVSQNRLPVYDACGEFLSAEFPPEVTFIPDFDVLDDPAKLKEYLSSRAPITSHVGGDGQFHKFADLGFDSTELVPIYCLVFPKKIGGKVPMIERQRDEFVRATFEEKHRNNTADMKYDADGFDEIADGFDESLGVSLICIGKDGSPVCLGTADIRYAATKPFEYDEGSGESSYPILEKYVNEYLKYAASNGDLIVENFNGVADEELIQREDGHFELVKGKVVIQQGEVPMNSLLNREAVVRPNIEISQMAGSEKFVGGSMFIAATLTKMLKKALDVNPNLKVGFSISPHLLKTIYRIKKFTIKIALEYLGLSNSDFENFDYYVNAFAHGFNVYPANESKITKITFKDRPPVYIKGTYAAGTFEVPAYFGSHTFN
jgi:hypothetical protein